MYTMIYLNPVLHLVIAQIYVCKYSSAHVAFLSVTHALKIVILHMQLLYSKYPYYVMISPNDDKKLNLYNCYLFAPYDIIEVIYELSTMGVWVS